MKLWLDISFRQALRYATSGLVALTIAACGGGGGSPGTVAGGSNTAGDSGSAGGGASSDVGSVSLIFSSTELKSAGTSGSEVTVTALVKSSGNTAIANVPVQFLASSGALTSVDSASDKNGQAKALLGPSGDYTNRKITVTATAGGKTATGTVDVVGTTLKVAGPSSISSGSTGDFTVSVKDSSNAPVANAPVNFSSQKGNTLAVQTSNGGSATAPLTNSQGQVVLRMTASQSGTDTLTFSSQGVTTTSVVAVDNKKVILTLVDGSGNATTTANTGTSCTKINVHYEIGGVPQTSGTVNVTSSRGQIYTNSGCTTLLSSSSVALGAGGDAQATYLKSNTAGVATVMASITGGPTAQSNIEFIALLTPAATISLQVDPAVIGANLGSSQSEKAALTAIVRDGTAYNNFVKDATVDFAIESDASGGTLTSSSVATGSDGVASAYFIAGSAATPTDGVKISATIRDTSKSATTTLTVSKKSLFISAGTGNKLEVPDDTTYRQNYTVFVTDASGNPVPGVAITASLWPTGYAKGTYLYDDVTAKAWVQDIVDVCANEDKDNRNGILDAGEDFNGNGILDPGIPASITASATTDSSGTAQLSVLYPRNRAQWLEVQLTIRGSVSGTESIYQSAPYFLPVLSTDVTDKNVSPPGATSPYGVHTCDIKN
ncbi:MAG TPA: Ig-like group 1 domain-containing protein [Noviherbaspirillum sp.]|nr:Ig-like group 1 domain-containing protein [Noviherbaspirillum sp.]